jgi:hypothetical protein
MGDAPCCRRLKAAFENRVAERRCLTLQGRFGHDERRRSADPAPTTAVSELDESARRATLAETWAAWALEGRQPGSRVTYQPPKLQ